MRDTINRTIGRIKSRMGVKMRRPLTYPVVQIISSELTTVEASSTNLNSRFNLGTKRYTFKFASFEAAAADSLDEHLAKRISIGYDVCSS